MGSQPWQLDVTTLASSTKGALADRGHDVNVTVEGTQTLTYTAVIGTLTLQSDLTITATVNGANQVTTRTVKGESTGRAFFSDDVAIPRDWDEQKLTVTDTFTQDDAPVDPIPWSVPHSWLDDTVGLVTTCSSDTLTLVARGTKEAWTFHPASWTPPATESPTPAP